MHGIGIALFRLLVATICVPLFVHVTLSLLTLWDVAER